VAVVVIVALLVVFIFIARNIQHGAEGDEEDVTVESAG
jgi:hypothetical protein